MKHVPKDLIIAIKVSRARCQQFERTKASRTKGNEARRAALYNAFSDAVCLFYIWLDHHSIEDIEKCFKLSKTDS